MASIELQIISLKDAREKFVQLCERLIEAEKSHVHNSAEESLSATIAAMNQFFEIAEGVDKRHANFVANDITDIGEHGLSILEKLIYQAEANKSLVEKNSLQELSLVIADWVIKNDGHINILEPIVDALAQLANALKEPEELIALADFMGQIADSCSDSIKQDIEITNMHRPWRILNINRGIVATRTHHSGTMRQVFSALIKALPMDAPGFFKEGMSEMVRLNYPQPVRDIMQEYFDQTDMPQIH